MDKFDILTTNHLELQVNQAAVRYTFELFKKKNGPTANLFSKAFSVNSQL